MNGEPDVKLAVVTGGSRGLGAALCATYAARGWEVIEFSRSGRFPFSVQADLASPESALPRFMQAFASAAALDVSEVVAVSSAAVLGPVGPVEQAAPAGIAAHMNVNVVSAMLFACAFFAAFRERDCEKSFINISSGAASRGLAGWSLYCASKAAMANYVRTIALEQEARPHPIRAFSVDPGVMDTAMQAEVRNADEQVFPDVERYIRLHREGRLADPRQVAEKIADLVASRPEPGGIYRP
jgi:NAD(P)-dependent dehydrogenase (short-subunit alcohol dehydrogenase family)